jgi:phosphatidate cytidylyltransferase
LSDQRTSDLRVRTLSAVALLAAVALAIYLGGLVLRLVILAGALVLVYEWFGLVRRFAKGVGFVAWIVVGVLYIGLAALGIALLASVSLIIPVLAIVIATDTGAYFVGRAVGGRKIAPSISPSKTWAGLFGGMAAAAMVAVLVGAILPQFPGVAPATWAQSWTSHLFFALTGALLAVVAQTGDFFESAMKRRAGVKDSGAFIPGHGGLFDRVDGLLPVAIVTGVVITALVVNALTGAA